MYADTDSRHFVYSARYSNDAVVKVGHNLPEVSSLAPKKLSEAVLGPCRC